MGSSPNPGSRAARRLRRFRRPAILLAGMWALGLLALGSVIVFENRVDSTRRAQVVIAEMHNQQGAMLAVAFSPATAGTGPVPSPAVTAQRLAGAKAAYLASIDTIAGLGNSDSPARIRAASVSYLDLIDRLSALVAANKFEQAASELGTSEQPGGVEARLQAELSQADLRYGADAARSREVATIGTVVAILFLLAAFSIALQYSVRARKRSHHDASTDALTGLGNRRKLFADMEGRMAKLGEQKMAVGIFDLDGFKAYNDTFGHPAGDALLARLGGRLAATVGDEGDAYRIGGDEFVVTTADADGERLLAAAQTALSERGTGFSIGCSRGGTRIVAGVTLEQALHVADQRLYANKRSVRGGSGAETKDALLQVLAEQNEDLVVHLGHVAELASLTAIGMDLTSRQVDLTRLAAELHDVGKAAIPASILDKPGALDADEQRFIERHSEIGERIVGAAPALEAIAPIVRSAHERVDGTGYPDGLAHGDIPIASRIIAVVDAFDAMTNDRPYRGAMSTEDALAELHRAAGTQFDAAVVDAFAGAMTDRLVVPRAA
jgi:diguanylate cyclase (GGDEF)-like protein